MATFTNVATLTYNGTTTNSNTVTGELLETLDVTKTALTDTYETDGDVTYVVVVSNTGTTDITGVTVTDDLGTYTSGTQTLTPLTFVPGSILAYADGVLQPTPAVNPGPPMTITGLTVPAGGSLILIYEARVNEFAPPQATGAITNTVNVSTVTGVIDATDSETVTAQQGPDLAVRKSLSPTVVAEDGQLTYTFDIENSGNTATTPGDNVTLRDTFNPILRNITVTLNGTPLTPGVDYTYNPTTGVFQTTPGRISVPAATFTQNPDGTFATTPGTARLVVTGTI